MATRDVKGRRTKPAGADQEHRDPIPADQARKERELYMRR